MHKRFFNFLACSVLSLLFWCFPSPTFAHEIKPIVVDASTLDADTVQWVMRVNLEAIMAGISAEHDDTDTDPNTERYQSLRDLSAAELKTTFFALSPELMQRFDITDEHAAALQNKIHSIEVIPADNASIARDSLITINSKLPAGSHQWRWRWQDSYAPIIFRYTDLKHPENNVSHYLEALEASPLISVSGPQAHASVMETVGEFVRLGFIHIIPKGLDHIVFVLGLVLLHPRFKPVLWQVTLFTLAHSITLGLAMLGKVSVPALWVEASIALSIVYIGLDNLADRAMNGLRMLCVFGFGLLHGLGFANVLSELGDGNQAPILSLASFNVGVELGQLLVVALFFLSIGFWTRNHSWYPSRVRIPLSIVIAALGAWWFVERVSA